MPHLVAPLISGIAGAANGTAEFYAAGTAVLSTSVFSDANGITPVATTTLDANGAAVRYLTERCDVVVKSSQGATVRQWTEGTDARLVRIENALLMGPNAAGQTVAGGRTTLHDGLTLARESLGDEDWYVNPNGTPFLIKDAIGSSTGVYYNVKSGFGARGNNTNDDTSAIQSAINAAQSAGGGIVFFPPGTYKLTGVLTVTAGITLLGCGTATTILSQDTSGLAGAWLQISASSVLVTGIRITANAAATGTCVGLSGGITQVIFEACRFGDHAGVAVHTAVTGAASVGALFVSCAFSIAATAGQFWDGTSTVPHVFTNCTFNASVVPTGPCFDGTPQLRFSNCIVNLLSTSGGVQVMDTTSSSSWSGCNLTSSNTSGTNVIGGTGGSLQLAAGYYTQAAGGTLNFSGGAIVRDSGVGLVTNGTIAWPTGLTSGGYSITRDRRPTSTSVAGTGYTPDASFGVHVVTHTSGASMAFANTAITSLSFDTPLTILYLNASGGGITPTWGTMYEGMPATAVNNNEGALYVLRFTTNTSGLGKWTLVSTTVVANIA